jgi:hypothetical protein
MMEEECTALLFLRLLVLLLRSAGGKGRRSRPHPQHQRHLPQHWQRDRRQGWRRLLLLPLPPPLLLLLLLLLMMMMMMMLLLLPSPRSPFPSPHRPRFW